MNYKLLLGILLFTVMANAQNAGPTRQTSISSSETIINGSYNYSCNVKFRFQSAGYSDKPTAMKVGITDFYIDKITYKGRDAATLLNDISYPIVVSQAQADVSGTIIMRRGNATWSSRFNIDDVRAGGLDNIDFSSSHRNEIFSIFGEDVTYNDVTPEMPAVSLSDIIASKVRDIINDMDRVIREEASQKKAAEEAQQVEEKERLAREEEENRNNEGDSTDTEEVYTNDSDDTEKSQAEKAEEERKRREDDATAIEERLKADRKRAAALEREREIAAEKITESISGIAEGFSEGVFTDLRLAANFRLSENIKDEDGNEEYSFIDMVSYDLGIGVGRSGFFSVGYGTPESDYREGSLFKVGLGFDVLSVLATGNKAGRYFLTLGVEGEFAFANTESIEDERSDVVIEDGILYGGAVTLRLFEIFHVGIGYGFLNSDENGPGGDKTFKGNYTNTIVGLNIPF
ncbi:hypothetical protein [Dokdonia sp. Hel_I_53]|uniref:hypothetical protein n=1 Tax=Dokdonia sp. Hel_I_53 TaxID=1566287 RepID=UPI00119B5EF2|nr:hypothetical protein [Dokdonia sp. Hel_I_53]TVZ51859.1 hypothetical protein OD90_1018 [Dokdonia sp. Hel_I_53]